MKYITRALAVIVTAVASLALLATSASAATYITNTGDDFRCYCGSSKTTTVAVVNHNQAYITQGSLNLVNTGFNQANRNIGSTSISTGNAGVWNYFSAQANSNWTAISF